MLAIAAVLGMGALLFSLYHLSRRQLASGRDVVTPAAAAPGKDVSVVGIAQPWEPPGVSPVSQEQVLYTRAHRTPSSGLGSKKNAGTPRSIGKVSTTFVVVDESNPQAAVAVDSGKLRELLVRTRTSNTRGRSLDGQGDDALSLTIGTVRRAAADGSLSEKAVYPGDRVWVHGPLVDHGGYLGFGRKAWLDDRAPDRRIERHTRFAAVGGVGLAGAGVLALAGLLGLG